MHKVLGLFIPLIVTNCAILGRAESFAFRQPVHPSLLDGLMIGLGFTLSLVMLGAVREIWGRARCLQMLNYCWVKAPGDWRPPSSPNTRAS